MTASALAAGEGQREARLVEQIYLAAVDPSHWQAFLEEIVAATGSRSARMLVLNPHADTVTASLKVNIDDADHHAYVDYYVNACPWRPELAHKTPGRLYSTFLDFSCRQPEFYRTEFFNDWAGPQDIHHGLCGTVYADSHQTVQLLVQRTRGQGHYTHQDSAAVNALVPHLRRAVVLSRETAHARMRAEAALEAANTRPLPFVLIDERGRVEHVTAEAAAMISGSRQIDLHGGRIRLRQAPADARLRRLVARICSGAGKTWHSAGGTVKVIREGMPPLGLLVMPVHPDVPALWSSRKAFAAVFLHDPASRVEVDGEVLAELYGLTAAEARVAVAVAQGVDPPALAASHGVSANTVRSQLKSVFRKTGAARQSELARIVLTGPACRRIPVEPTHPLR